MSSLNKHLDLFSQKSIMKTKNQNKTKTQYITLIGMGTEQGPNKSHL